jgi:hypothetical protein
MVPNSQIHLMNINLEFRLPVPYNQVVQTFIPMALVRFFAAINLPSIFSGAASIWPIKPES